jgi:polyferredoxin/plastocyanin
MKRLLPILALIAIGGTFVSCGSSQKLSGTLSGKQRTIEIRAKRYAYSPSVITVNKGETVIIKLISEDVSHGFYLDGYDIEFSVAPGETRTVNFKADKSGRFSFRCSKTCGEFHPYMIGYFKVQPNTKYYAGMSLIVLLGIGSLVLGRRTRGNPHEKLFGIIPLDWRFELTKYKPVRALFKSRWFPFVFILLNVFVFTIILIAGFVGGFSAGNYNFGVMIVWILWWVLLMTIFVPIIGRFWCMICPFPLIGDWLQRGKLVGVGRQKSKWLNKKWPKKFRNLWPLTVLFFVATFFSGFFTVRPFATFLLLTAIIGAAVIISLIYEKRTFCLYVCPVSGFQGLYANFAACEVRVKDPEICKTHTPKTCYVGNDKGYGCPWLELPYDMNRNTYCGLCLECFKTCPYDNMAFNLRPFGADFLSERKRTDDLYNRRGLDEAFKSLTMIGILFAFFITMQGPYGFIKDMVRATTLGGYALFLGVYTVLNFLLVPGLFLLFSYLSKLASGNKEVSLKDVFVNFSYALVPIGVARWAAFSIGIMLPNGSYILHILSDPFAWGWNLFGTAGYPWTPVLTGAMGYLQTGILIIGLIFALEYGYKFARQTYANEKEALRGWIPMLIFILGLSIFFLWLFGG